MNIDKWTTDEFELLFAKYGVFDYTLWHFGFMWRYRGYHDGGWLEGYELDPVMYWGA